MRLYKWAIIWSYGYYPLTNPSMREIGLVVGDASRDITDYDMGAKHHENRRWSNNNRNTMGMLW